MWQVLVFFYLSMKIWCTMHAKEALKIGRLVDDVQR